MPTGGEPGGIASREAVTVATEIVAQHGDGTWPKVIDWAAMAKGVPGYVQKIAATTGLTLEALASRGVEYVQRAQVSERAVEALRCDHRKGLLNWGPELA